MSAFRIGYAQRRLCAAITAVVLVLSLTVVTPSVAAAFKPMVPQQEKPVNGAPVPVTPRDDGAATAHALRGSPPVTWPGAGATEIAVGAASSAAAPFTLARKGDAPSRIRLETLDRKRTNVTGVAFRVARADGVAASSAASIELDYSGFRAAYGGDWAHRLRVVRLPECALSTPDRPECAGTEVPTVNHARTARLSADLVVPAAGSSTLYAATAGPSGPTGTAAATTLSPSSTWSAGNPTGDFTWSYPMRIPPGLGGPSPRVGLAYASSGVDGRTVATNNQPSIIGEGFEFHPGFVERRYRSCADDTTGGNNATRKTGDQCWATDNAVVSLNGGGGELVRDDATGAWRIRGDDGSRVERFTGASNGDNDGEHWRVTDTAGTQYYFGLNRLPGWSAGRPETNSALTVPVFGNHAGEPCHSAAGFGSSWCQQAYRWQLDYVVDVRGNVMSYHYQQESNLYALNLDAAKPVGYARASWLERVEYGKRDVFATAPARVLFEPAERCVAGTICEWSRPQNYPDTPLDQLCSGGSCPDKWSPTFFTTKRLSKVKTQVWDGMAHRDVDSWTLAHEFPDPGDGTRAGLWLKAITHTGHVGGAATMNAVEFRPVQRPNRVMRNEDTRAPMNWLRIGTIHNETGGTTALTYSTAQCSWQLPNSMPTSPDSNNMRCMPVKVPRPGSEDIDTDWFHKYVVEQVVETDRVGGNPSTETRYQYHDGAAWHYDDDDGLVDPKYKTWSQWRGYGRVRTIVGAEGKPAAPQIVSERRFFRGMHDDRLANGGRRQVFLDGVADVDEFAGQTRETITNRGPSGPVVASAITTPWRSGPTATRISSWGTVTARRADVEVSVSSTRMPDGSMRSVEVRRGFDQHGVLREVSDLGDANVSGDEKCVRYTHVRSTDRWILDLVARTEKVAVSCDQSPSRPEHVLADTRVYYDNATAIDAVPVRGDVTRTEKLAEYVNGVPRYVLTGRAAYDEYGRGIETFDAKGEKTTMSYSQPNGGLLKRTTTTNPLGWTSTTDFEPAWGVPLATTDANGLRADMEYDPLGRLAKAWTPDRPKAGNYLPAVEFGYVLLPDRPVVTTTKSIKPNGNYVTTYEIFDGFLRARQSQLPAAGGGRILNDTFYDSRGLAYKQFRGYYNKQAPGTALLGVVDADVPAMSLVEYDNLGLPTAEILYTHGEEVWRRKVTHEGDRAHAFPPGASPVTSIKNAVGQVTEVRQHRGADTTGPYEKTQYGYTASGQLSSIVDPAGNTWRYHYDMRGRLTRTEDPDKGATVMAYNDADELLSTTDARGITVAYAYDRLGRRTAVHDSSLNGPKRAEWVYDTLRLGQLTKSVRYAAGGAAYEREVIDYDGGYRPLGVAVNLPSNEGALAGTYEFWFDYAHDGSVAAVTHPAVGGLPGETIQHSYDDLGMPKATYSALGYYVSETGYTPYGEVAQVKFDFDGPEQARRKTAWRTFTYSNVTRKLQNAVTERETGPHNRIADVTYGYDSDGQVLSVSDRPQGQPADTQCFEYDHFKRLIEAWTPASADCEANRSVAALGGAEPYWTSWTYDGSGNRETETHRTAAAETLRSYGYPQPGQPRPHSVKSVSSTTTPTGGTVRLEYGYDNAGNTLNRPGKAGAAQTLSWDPEGQLSKVVEGGDTTSFVYDADGTRLLRRDTASTTLFLAGMDIRLDNTSKTVRATRYYAHGGAVIAMRTPDALTWLSSDHNGTSDVAIRESDQAVQRRRFTPFGEERGSVPAWPDRKGFLGGEKDPTGMTHLGAREYDPTIGRFISVDPLMDPLDPQQMHGYSYANNNPVTLSDPSGLMAANQNCGPDGRWCTGVDAGYDACGDVADCHAALEAMGQANAAAAQAAANVKNDPDYQAAQRVKQKSKWDIVVEIGKEALKEFTGWNDIKDCFANADLLACGSMIISAIPWYKVPQVSIKLPGIIAKIGSALASFGEKLAWAEGIIKSVEDKASAAAQSAYNAVISRNQSAFAPAKTADTKAPDVNGATARTGGGNSCATNSFTPGTQVLLADGSTIAIEDVQPGDEVVVTDPETNETATRAVTVTITGDGVKDLVEISLAGQDETLTATAGHPFWVQSQQAWRDAKDLLPSDLLRTAAGTYVQVSAVRAWTSPQRVHNLTVADIHTYHVVAGGASALVHNCGDTPAGVACVCRSGTGAGPADAPIRVAGPWTRGDIGRGAHGRRPNHLGDRIELHHADQMPGSAIHELDQVVHRGPGTDLHRNVDGKGKGINQGVTGPMRAQDTELHWWYRSQEQGWGHYGPEFWYDNWPSQ